MRSGPCLLHGSEDQFRRLRSGDAIGAIEHEERDAGDAQLAGLQLVMTDVVGIGVAGEHVADGTLVETRLDRESREDVVLANRRSLDKVARHQALLECVLPAHRMREVDQAVCIEGVARPRAIEVEVKAFGRGVGGHTRLSCLGSGATHAVLGSQPLHRITLCGGRSTRIKLETAPGHVHLALVIERSQGALETPLADVAPGTDDVGPDLNLHGSVVPHSRPDHA